MPYEYYLACHDCKNYILAVHGVIPREDTINQFLAKHRGHKLEFLDERGVGFFPYIETEEGWKEDELS